MTPGRQADPERWRIVANVGGDPCCSPDEGQAEITIDDELALVLRGRTPSAADQRVLEAFAAQAALALRQHRLTEEAEQARPLAEADRMRTALLTAVSHDLRSPLSSAKAAVESLRAGDVTGTSCSPPRTSPWNAWTAWSPTCST
jgi:two-component system sensor histidine kinase KdpD